VRLTKFEVHRDVIGSLKHVSYEAGKISWKDDLLPSEWVFDRDEGSIDRCLKTLLKVNGVEVSYSPGATQQKVYGKVLPNVKFTPWSLCLPANTYKETVKNFLASLSLMDVDAKYYDNVFTSYRELVSEFKPFRVDEKLLRAGFETASDALMVHLETLLPGGDGLVQPPKYNFFGTRTGRLTVASGPMVLTLPKDKRNLFLAEKGSKVVQIDFSSLEPRLLSALAKLPAVEGDLYENISRTVFSGDLPRDKVKVAILGIMYGMSVDTLSNHIGLPVDDCRVILQSVKQHLRVKEILSKIERETVGDVSKNYFGKVFEINKQSMLNNYVQSSGVDVVHMGFHKLVKEAKERGINFKPMFLVHDALVGEVSNSDRKALEALVKKGSECPQLGTVFPLTMSDFANAAQNMEH
jgi:hypothetical protein